MRKIIFFRRGDSEIFIPASLKLVSHYKFNNSCCAISAVDDKKLKDWENEIAY